jgi:hypothetical protein
MRLCSYGLPDVLKAFVVACNSVLHWPLIAQCSWRYSKAQDYQYVVQLTKEKLTVTCKTQSLLYITPGLMSKNSKSCPHDAFSCFIWISEQMAIISTYSINWLSSVNESECLLCCTSVIFNYNSGLMSSKWRGRNDINKNPIKCLAPTVKQKSVFSGTYQIRQLKNYDPVHDKHSVTDLCLQDNHALCQIQTIKILLL